MATDHPLLRQLALTAAALALLAAGCGGPRTKMFSTDKYTPLPPDAKVDVFVGELPGTNKPVAIIESKAYGFVDDTVKKEQIEQLRKQARALGANAIDNVHILPKRIQRYTVDERAPIQAVQQGRTELYFMRATAVRVGAATVAATSETQAVQRPVIEQLPPPRPLANTPATTATAQPALPPPPNPAK